MAIPPTHKNIAQDSSVNDTYKKIANFVPDNTIDTNSKSQRTALGLSKDFNTFLKLLVVQVKNQDPTDPMDVNEFTQQLVAFTGVEQAVATNSNLEKLIEFNKGVQFSNAAGLVGKEVIFDNTTTSLKSGNEVDFLYSLEPTIDQKIESTSIRIINSKGQIVYDTNGKRVMGDHTFHWDGLDYDKNKCPNDTYKIDVKAIDSNGKPVSVSNQQTSGTISEAVILGGEVFVKINGNKIPVSQIKALKSNETNKEMNLSSDTLNAISEMLKKKTTENQ